MDNIIPTQEPTVFLPNMEEIHTTHSGLLPWDNLSPTSKTANILPKLHSASLIFLGQLCDDNCNITLDKKYLKVYKNDTQIIKGYRNIHDGLWDIHIPVQPKLHHQKWQ